MGTVSSYLPCRSLPQVWLPGIMQVAPFSAVKSSNATNRQIMSYTSPFSDPFSLYQGRNTCYDSRGQG